MTTHRRLAWWIGLRGVAAIVFGVIALVWPGVTVAVLVALFGIYAFLDGIGSLVAATRREVDRGQRIGYLVEGILGILAGLLAFVWPGPTALVLLVIIATWAILTGIAEIVAAIRLRRQLRNEWLLALAGVLSVIVGVLLLARPGAGILTVAIVIGIYALAFGIGLVALAIRLWRAEVTVVSLRDSDPYRRP